MAKVAIIGTGIAGLSAAYHLYKHHDITVYEKASRIGGHTRTLRVHHGDRTIAVDTGFIVFNERNYPNLVALFRELGVAVKKSDMSFALTVGDGWLEWAAHSVNAILGQRRNLFRPGFLRLFAEVVRFNAQAHAALDADPAVTLGALIESMGLGEWFRRYYLLPMAGAIWSCPPRQMLEFPARSFVRFFANHGLLSAMGQPQWYTVDGGSQAYVDRMVAPFAGSIRTGCGAAEIRRVKPGVIVRDDRGQCETFDHVVLASHADQSLKLLGDATNAERATLGAFGYQNNTVVLHKDRQFMPRRRRCWASWVYHSDGMGDEAAITVTYWMNRLQSIDARYPLFVTLNPAREIPAEHIFDRHEFAHPVFDREAIAAQQHLMTIQGIDNTWFCGAYTGYGFHEDGFVSGMVAASALDRAAGRGARMPIAVRRRANIAFAPAQSPMPAVAMSAAE